MVLVRWSALVDVLTRLRSEPSVFRSETVFFAAVGIDDGDLGLLQVNPAIALRIDRGINYLIPTTFCGSPIKAHPLNVGLLGLSRFEAALVDARNQPSGRVR